MPSRWLWLAALVASAAPVQADYLVTFYSHERGADFPHAFVTIKGQPDHGGPAINTDYGFTAKAMTPAVLFGSVPGTIDHAPAGYISRSQKHFTLIIHDAQYAAILRVVAHWGSYPGNVYNLTKHNCVSFIADVGSAVGLRANVPPGLVRHPKAYLDSVLAANPILKP